LPLTRRPCAPTGHTSGSIDWQTPVFVILRRRWNRSSADHVNFIEVAEEWLFQHCVSPRESVELRDVAALVDL
jgi:hypothetical protein